MTDNIADIGYALSVDYGDALIVDTGGSESNRIELAFENLRQARRTASIEIAGPCGSTPEALLAGIDARVEMRFSWVQNNEKREASASPQRGHGGDEVVWRLRGALLDSGTTLTAVMSQFEANTVPGSAALRVKLVDGDDKQAFEGTVEIRKQLKAIDGPAIRYLAVSTDFCRPDMPEPIKITFVVTGPAGQELAPILYRNGRPVPRAGKDPRPGEVVVEQVDIGDGQQQMTGSLTERPDLTTVYRLALRHLDVAPRMATVQVMTRGWNSIGQAFGYATGVFIGPDYETGEAGGIYGVFVDDRQQPARAAIYVSHTGTDDWRWIADVATGADTEHDLAFSPGAMFDGKLWLVGGSASDMNKRSAAIWYFDRERGLTQPCDADGNVIALPAERSGHAVLSLPSTAGHDDQLVILGGSGTNGRYLNDVVSITRAGTTTQGRPIYRMETILEEAAWTRRHRHAAAVISEDGRPLVYLYGGRDAAAAPLADLWCWTPGDAWSPVKVEEDDDGSIIRPSPGRPEAVTLIAMPQFDQDDRFLLLGVFRAGDENANVLRARIYERFWVEGLWAERELPVGWEIYAGRRFWVQGIATPYALLVWTVDPDRDARLDPLPPLNVFIPG